MQILKTKIVVTKSCSRDKGQVSTFTALIFIAAFRGLAALVDHDLAACIDRVAVAGVDDSKEVAIHVVEVNIFSESAPLDLLAFNWSPGAEVLKQSGTRIRLWVCLVDIHIVDLTIAQVVHFELKGGRTVIAVTVVLLKLELSDVFAVETFNSLALSFEVSICQGVTGKECCSQKSLAERIHILRVCLLKKLLIL